MDGYREKIHLVAYSDELHDYLIANGVRIRGYSRELADPYVVVNTRQAAQARELVRAWQRNRGKRPQSPPGRSLWRAFLYVLMRR